MPIRCTAFGVAADPDDLAQVLERVRAPVPHVEGVDAVVGVRGPVQVGVPGVGRVLLLEPLLDDRRVGRLGEHLLEEVDVRRVVQRVERVRHRVVQDQRAALADERLPPVHVEEVAEPQAHREHRVHDRAVDVVRAQVRQAEHEHVALALHLDQLLAVHVLDRALVHRLDRTGLHRRHLVVGDEVRQRLAAQPRRRAVEAVLHRPVRRLVARRPLPLALGEEAVRPRERLVVERGLDLEHLHVLLQQPAHPPGATSAARSPCGP